MVHWRDDQVERKGTQQRYVNHPKWARERVHRKESQGKKVRKKEWVMIRWMKNEECGMKITRSKISHFSFQGVCDSVSFMSHSPPFQSPTPHIHTTWSS